MSGAPGPARPVWRDPVKLAVLASLVLAFPIGYVIGNGRERDSAPLTVPPIVARETPGAVDLPLPKALEIPPLPQAPRPRAVAPPAEPATPEPPAPAPFVPAPAPAPVAPPPDPPGPVVVVPVG